MLQLYYQYYFLQLDGFITTKKVLIIRIYPIITILKLKLNNKFNPGLYQDV